MSLTFGELFAGVGGFSIGAERAGWSVRWQVEWDKHCADILTRHWPDVPKWGDVRAVKGTDLEPVDVILFGSPCQDLSVAGSRNGLAGARSGLFFEAIRIIKEMRDGTDGARPRLVVWENVPGAISSNQGQDFLAVLDAFAEVGAVDVAWRVLDAQFFGVPQRRRRVFVAADLGGECAGAILAEPTSLLWNHPPRRASRQETAGGSRHGTTTDRGDGEGVATGSIRHDGLITANGSDVSGPLTAVMFRGPRGTEGIESNQIVLQTLGTGGDVAPALTAKMAKGTGGPAGDECQNLILQVFPIQSTIIGRADHHGPNGSGYGKDGEPMYTLDARDPHGVATPYVKVVRSGARDSDGLLPPEVWKEEDVAPTLNAFENHNESRATVLAFDSAFGSQAGIHQDISPPVKVGSGLGISSPPAAMIPEDVPPLSPSGIIRRLTPRECERLQGWPDDHTRWRADGTEQSDSQRYKQCGNGVASPVVTWIALALTEAIEAEA